MLKSGIYFRYEGLINQKEKRLVSLLSVESRQLWETERCMSNRMKNRAVGPASVISLHLPGFRCAGASVFFHLSTSSFYTGSIAACNGLIPRENLFQRTNSINHMKIR